MVLLIDNYDSFTYNLYDYILQLGLECLVIRNDEKTLAEIQKLKFNSIVISPGPGIPSNAGVTNELIKYYYNKKPILGICLGHQALGEFFGAKLVKSEKPVHGKTSTLFFNDNPLFFNITDTFEVMRYHSLVLKELKLPLETIATTSIKEIMAFSHNELPIVGIQFHLESILTENGLLLMQNFFEKIALTK
jgi:anthranilate synthase/aminodeoxychorismate synthase-like glutamine amidotransferase